jgi:hypothetical protein
MATKGADALWGEGQRSPPEQSAHYSLSARPAASPPTQAQLTTLQASLADAERRVFESELIRRKLHNTIQVRRRVRRGGS